MPDSNFILWKNISELPYFRGLLRAVESRFYQNIYFEKPVLDLGCGDGHFASVAFIYKLDIGLDPWYKSLYEANHQKAYNLCVNAQGNEIPFKIESFKTIISNSVLEHIDDIDAVLHEIWRILKPRGKLIFSVPNDDFTRNLSIARMCKKIYLPGLANTYCRLFNRISRHKRCDSPVKWIRRLTMQGFIVKRWWKYFSPKALAIMEWGHYFGLPSLISKCVFGQWILVPKRWNLLITEAIISKVYQEDIAQPQGAYTFIIAEKKEQK
jgi:SAM-dependent methyltransferase